MTVFPTVALPMLFFGGRKVVKISGQWLPPYLRYKGRYPSGRGPPNADCPSGELTDRVGEACGKDNSYRNMCIVLSQME